MRLRLGVCLLAMSCFREQDGPATGSTAGDADSTSTMGGGSTTIADASTTLDLPSTGEVTGTTAIDASSDTGPPPVCDSTESEVPTIPLGWSGPYAVVIGGIGETVRCPDELVAGPVAYDQGMPTTCTCTCEGEPGHLCDLVAAVADDCPVGVLSSFEPCANMPGSSVRWAADPGFCKGTASVALDGAAMVQSCELPDAACVTVPEALVGPCVIGPVGDCPDGYQDPQLDTELPVVECPPCDPCSTAEYCAELEIEAWSGKGCNGTVQVLETPEVCSDLAKGSVGSLRAASSAALPSCSIDAEPAPSLRLCCASDA